MSEKRKKVYQPASLEKYSFRERMAIRVADLAFYLLIVAIGKTMRVEVRGWDRLEGIEGSGRIPIYCIWHNRIFAATYCLRNRGIVVMTSQSFDGEYIARFIQRLGFGAARGSSTRGGREALVEMIRLMREGAPGAFTVDGPKGPRYEAKVGPCLLAKKTGNPMLPFSVECSSFWTVNSWDKLQIPKPFCRALLVFEEPIDVPEEADEELVEQKRRELQASLERAVQAGEEWRRQLGRSKA